VGEDIILLINNLEKKVSKERGFRLARGHSFTYIIVIYRNLRGKVNKVY
jgi:hypothetical protein